MPSNISHSAPLPRLIQHHGSDPYAAGTTIDDRVVSGCWFEWHRQGGCGPGELRFERRWIETTEIQPGDWISIGTAAGDRWYLGRVDQIVTTYPAGASVTLSGMMAELNEIFPGGFGRDAGSASPQQAQPERLGRTDAFPNDPDHSVQQAHPIGTVREIVLDLADRFVLPQSHVDSIDVGSLPINPAVDSMTFRGEESLRSIFKDLAVRAGGVAYGIDASGRFFFHAQPSIPVSTLRLTGNVLRCSRTESRDILFNRLLLTGDFIYDRQDAPLGDAHRAYRYRRVFERDTSLTEYGEHRIRLWLPWIRTDFDAQQFAAAFFDQYAAPPAEYLVDAIADAVERAMPWLGTVVLQDETGATITSNAPSVVRVQFDDFPKLRVMLGPEDPRRLWPDPGEDERYELAPVRDNSSETIDSSSLTSQSSDALSSVENPPGGSSIGESSATSEWPTSEWPTSLWSTSEILTSEWLSSEWLSSGWPSSEWLSSHWQSFETNATQPTDSALETSDNGPSGSHGSGSGGTRTSTGGKSTSLAITEPTSGDFGSTWPSPTSEISSSDSLGNSQSLEETSLTSDHESHSSSWPESDDTAFTSSLIES